MSPQAREEKTYVVLTDEGLAANVTRTAEVGKAYATPSDSSYTF